MNAWKLLTSNPDGAYYEKTDAQGRVMSVDTGESEIDLKSGENYLTFTRYGIRTNDTYIVRQDDAISTIFGVDSSTWTGDFTAEDLVEYATEELEKALSIDFLN